MKYVDFGGDEFVCSNCRNRNAMWLMVCVPEYAVYLCNHCLINKKDVLINWHANKFYKTHKLYKIKQEK